MTRLSLILIALSALAALTTSCTGSRIDKLGAEGELCQIDNDCRSDFVCVCGTCQPLGTTADICGGGNVNNNDPNNDLNNDFNNDNNDFNNDNNDFNNDFNNDNNDDFIFEACEDLCDFAEDCFGESVGDDCAEECGQQFQNNEDILECFLELSCEELFEDGGQQCFEGESFCGDGICQGDEFEFCPEDCGGGETFCGDGICEGDEPDFCPDDCFGDDEVFECQQICEEIFSCEEFFDRCDDETVFDALQLCFDACQDRGFREQVFAAEGLPCESIVPAVIDGFGLDCR